MLVFRICLEKWSHELRASGHAARWNSEGVYLIYTAGSRALACLENLVHRSGEGNHGLFRTLEIVVPASVSCYELPKKSLSAQWHETVNYPLCRSFGDEWIRSGRSCIMKVPSALIPEEFNYLINPQHKDFKRIKIKNVHTFLFDGRFF